MFFSKSSVMFVAVMMFGASFGQQLDGDSTFPSQSTNINTDNETSSPSLGHSGSNTNSTSSHPSWIKKAKNLIVPGSSKPTNESELSQGDGDNSPKNSSIHNATSKVGGMFSGLKNKTTSYIQTMVNSTRHAKDGASGAPSSLAQTTIPVLTLTAIASIMFQLSV